jgi:hypothetical protein
MPNLSKNLFIGNTFKNVLSLFIFEYIIDHKIIFYNLSIFYLYFKLVFKLYVIF